MSSRQNSSVVVSCNDLQIQMLVVVLAPQKYKQFSASCLFVYPSPSVCVRVCVFFSLSLYLSLYPSPCLCALVSQPPSVFVHMCVHACVCLSPSLCLSHYASPYLCILLSHPPFACVCVCAYVRTCVRTCACVSFSLPWSLSLSVSLLPLFLCSFHFARGFLPVDHPFQKSKACKRCAEESAPGQRRAPVPRIH